MPGQIGYHPNEFNWHLSQWIYSQFDWSNLTGHEILLKMGIYLNRFTPNSTGHEILLKMGVNSLRLHCMPVWSNWVSSQWKSH